MSARASHEYENSNSRLMRTAYLDLQVAADYLDELLNPAPGQRSLFEEVSV